MCQFSSILLKFVQKVLSSLFVIYGGWPDRRTDSRFFDIPGCNQNITLKKKQTSYTKEEITIEIKMQDL
jgi:hypothetical protein